MRFLMSQVPMYLLPAFGILVVGQGGELGV